MITQSKTANAVGGKTARACESCLKKRASWFCPSDDAFLCHACDSLVHTANELAGRHKRVRCGIASLESPSWHQGFTKKARTPRNPKAKPSCNNNTYQMRIVPEVSNNDDNEGYSIEENEENDMVFSVPTFDINNNNSNNNGNSNSNEEEDKVDNEFNISMIGFDGDDWDNMPGFLPSEKELPEFGMNVESLLEQEEAVKLDDEDGSKSLHNVCIPGVKIEEEGESTTDHCYLDWSIDVESEMLNFDLNYNCVNDESQVSGGEEEEDQKKVMVLKQEDYASNNSMIQAKKRRKILLRLNYEEVINAWATLGCSSPWTTGRRPELNLDNDGWPICMGALGPTGVQWIGVRGNVHGGDGGREARVSRYREKRRTRLFSKKIRYEVRKLNAEKRPRLKGRFVKRTSLSSSSLSPYMNK